MTCADVQSTLRVQRAPEIAWAGAFLKQPIREIACPSPYRAVFRFERPLPTALLDANDDAIVPSSYAAIPFAAWASRRWEQQAVTSGPYRLARVVAGQEAVLERDPSYWDAPRPNIPRVVFRVYPDGASALRAFLAGEVDVLEKVPPQRTADVASAGTLFETPSLAYTIVAWNALDPDAYRTDRKARGCSEGRCPAPESEDDIRRLQRDRPHAILADARVRRALTLAIDRDDLVRGVFAGHARTGASPIVSALWAHDASTALPFDPSAARRSLDEAGWRDADGDGVRERNGRALALEVLVDADNAVRRDALERIAANLRTVGVRIDARPLPRAEFVARLRDKAFDGAITGWRAGTRIEPQAVLHTRAAKDRGNNVGAWSTPASDELLDRAAAAREAREARPLWSRWQRLFRDEQPFTVLYEENVLVALSRRVADATPTALNPYAGLERWRLRPAERRK